MMSITDGNICESNKNGRSENRPIKYTKHKRRIMIAIVKYNAGNVQSVRYALERLGHAAILTDKEDELRQADRVIFPGVGEASTSMAYLKARGLDLLIPTLTQPVLGICLGMQLMCNYSEENNTTCLGIFDQQVRRFPNKNATNQKFKVPKIGWNQIRNPKTSLFTEVGPTPWVYFVHSYYVELGAHTIAQADYVLPYSAALNRGNFYATQFHPEKSSDVGAQILKNFIEL